MTWEQWISLATVLLSLFSVGVAYRAFRLSSDANKKAAEAQARANEIAESDLATNRRMAEIEEARRREEEADRLKAERAAERDREKARLLESIARFQVRRIGEHIHITNLGRHSATNVSWNVRTSSGRGSTVGGEPTSVERIDPGQTWLYHWIPSLGMGDIFFSIQWRDYRTFVDDDGEVRLILHQPPEKQLHGSNFADFDSFE